MTPEGVTLKVRAGLFLDLDGTLADSLPVMRLAYERFLAHFGKPASAAEFAGLNGPPLPAIVARLAATHGLTPPHDDLLALYRQLIGAGYLEVAPAAGARGLLEAARQLGLRTAVVTSNTAALALAWLARVDLAGLVDVVVGGEEVSRGKPDPEPYLLALQRSGCAPPHSYAVEDSLAGARSAAAAGLTTFLLAGHPVALPAGMRAAESLAQVRAFLLAGSAAPPASR